VNKVAQKIYDRIDNDLYDAEGDRWWQSDSPLNLIKYSINPARVGYLEKILFNELKLKPQGKSALEVGCGGGILSEEIARMGFDLTGIDPSKHSLQIASDHAKAGRLRIKYDIGTGEALPYRDNAFDIVLCFDVLEHVRDVPKVISEISRVLKPGGVFCYDTFNRTFMSKLVAINISQVWKRFAFAPPNLHVWEMFIKPDELKSLLRQTNLEWKEHKGMDINVSLFTFLKYLRKRAKGELSYKGLGKLLFLVESNNLSIMYMGYAIKSEYFTKP
jgi:2-polyprenyl-6-hydroxyphenyl methylase/3-demethylubiquinone-9 3-methyltransferase